MGVDVSKGFGQLIDESVALWSKMVFEEARQKHQIVMNAKDIQQEGLELVDNLQGKLEMLFQSMQAIFAVLDDARREHSIAAEKYQTYEAMIAELRAQLAVKTAELQRCYGDKDKLFAELAKMRGKLDLLMAQQDDGDSAELIKQLREQRDKAVSESEGLKGQIEELMRLINAEKETTLRAQADELDAKKECDRIKGQMKPLKDEMVNLTSDTRLAKKEALESRQALDGLKGEIVVFREQIAESEKERIRQREHRPRLEILAEQSVTRAASRAARSATPC